MESFSTWKKSVHARYEQLKAQKKALNIKFDSIDVEARKGKIGKLRVSLERCNCIEFRKYHKPCKHIYRLAFDLGIFNLNAKKIDEALKTAPKKKLYGCELSFQSLPPKNFVVIDFERANLSKDSICQVGIIVVKNNRVTEQKKFLIRPPYKEFTATNIHGITFDDVKNKPTFKKLWTQIKKYFDGQIIAAFALPHDLSYLFATLKRYKLPRPNFMAFDVQSNVQTCLKENFHESLADVAKKFNLVHDSHDALSDALVTAQIQIQLSKDFPDKETTIYISTVTAIAEGFVRGKIPQEIVVDYCKKLLADKKTADITAYVKFLRKIKQAESKLNIFREKSDELERALYKN